jgi:hypothetical protein
VSERKFHPSHHSPPDRTWRQSSPHGGHRRHWHDNSFSLSPSSSPLQLKSKGAQLVQVSRVSLSPLLPLIILELSLAHGQRTLTVHGLTESSLQASTALPGLYTICANYDKAPVAQRYLSSSLGEDYYHPFYLSRKEDTACFVAILNEQRLVDLDLQEFVR